MTLASTTGREFHFCFRSWFPLPQGDCKKRQVVIFSECLSLDHSFLGVDEMMMMMSAHLNSCTAYLDTSVAFKQYLRRYGMDDALKKHRVQLRSIHNIVPHVCSLSTSADGRSF
jgi:hypothetical protein